MKKKILSLLLCLALIAATFGCAPKNQQEKPESNPSSETSETSEEIPTGEAFDKFCEELFVSEVTSDAVTLNYTLMNPESYGIERYPKNLYSLDFEKSKEDYKEVRELSRELRAFKYDELDLNQRITYDVLSYYLNQTAEGEKYELYYEPLSPLYGDHAQLPIVLAEFKFNSEKDIQSYLAALTDIERYYGEIIDFEKRKAEAGLFMSDRILEDVLSQCEAFTKDETLDFMLRTFEARLASVPGLSEEQKTEYIERNKTAVSVNMKNAYRILIDGLTELKGSRKAEEGLCKLPGGKEYYEYLLRQKTSTDLSVEEIKAVLLQKLSSLISEMNSATKELPHNPQLGLDMTSPEEILEDLKTRTEKSFPKLPDVGYTVKSVDKAMEDFLSPAFYMSPPIDDGKTNSIYINHSPQYAGENLYNTLAHEGYPGHLYQSVYFNEVEASELRKLFSGTCYTEGWATYVETVIARDSAASFLLTASGHTNMVIFALSDIKVNYENYSKKELASFLAEYYGESSAESLASWVYETVVNNPGSYFPYIFGCTEIERLRDAEKARLGGAFDLKEFHKKLLDLGPVPFTVAEKYMKD